MPKYEIHDTILFVRGIQALNMEVETASWCSGLTCRPVTAKIVGSNPIEVAIFAQVAQSVEQGTENPRVGGSIPSLSTTNNFICGRGGMADALL